MMAISGVAVLEVTAGVVLIWSGVRGKTIASVIEEAASGHQPGNIGTEGISSSTGTSTSTGGSGNVANVPATSAQVNAWINAAGLVLAAHGEPLSAADKNAIKIIIHYESGGNPRAINLSDSNAAAGDPSRGLMQLIGTTFAGYALPGYNTNIYDPVSNIIAGVRYARDRYGSLENVPGVVAVSNGEPYVGY